MARRRHLSRAPITEAVIDLRVEVHEGTGIDALDTDLIERETGYRRIGPLAVAEFGIALDIEGGANPKLEQEQVHTIGSRFHSADEKYVAQLSIRGFTFSRLAPYEEWPTLTTEARRVWDVYARCLRPRLVSRVATRFINDLQLPMTTGGRFENYLASPLGLPDPAFGAVASFLIQYEGHDHDTEATVKCTQVLRPGLHERVLPVIIDIDVFRTQRFSFDDRVYWPYLDRLREVENRVFFSLLTEVCAELYE